MYYLNKYSAYTFVLTHFKFTRKKIRNAFGFIDFDFAEKVSKIPGLVKLAPKQKICDACQEKVNRLPEYRTLEHDIGNVDLNSDQSISALETSISKK